MENDLFDLTGKVAVVTGGNGGIGLGCAIGLAKAGANVAVWGRDARKNTEAISQLQRYQVEAIACQVDVISPHDLEAARLQTLDLFGGIDILVASAGATLRKRPEEFTKAEWDHIFAVNVTGLMASCQTVYPSMVSRGGGKIITIGSLTSLQGMGISPAYAASKGAVLQYTKSIAVAWGGENIQANCILPGWTETDLTAQSRSIPALNAQVASRTPAGRWGKPDDYEGVAVFLASRASDYVTGVGIPVDGGFSSTLVMVDLPQTTTE